MLKSLDVFALKVTAIVTDESGQQINNKELICKILASKAVS